FVVFVAVVAVIPLLVLELKTLQKDLKAKDLYEQEKQYLTLSKFNYIDSEFQESFPRENELDHKLIKLYEELENSAKLQYIFMNDIQGAVFNHADINTSK